MKQWTEEAHRNMSQGTLKEAIIQVQNSAFKSSFKFIHTDSHWDNFLSVIFKSLYDDDFKATFWPWMLKQDHLRSRIQAEICPKTKERGAF